MIKDIMEAVAIPMMAKARTGHFVERQREEVGAPLDLLKETAKLKRTPVVNFAAGGIATPMDAALTMQLGCGSVFAGGGIFKSVNTVKRARAIIQAVTYFRDVKILAEAVAGLATTKLDEGDKLTKRDARPLQTLKATSFEGVCVFGSSISTAQSLIPQPLESADDLIFGKASNILSRNRRIESKSQRIYSRLLGGSAADAIAGVREETLYGALRLFSSAVIGSGAKLNSSLIPADPKDLMRICITAILGHSFTIPAQEIPRGARPI
ncbi:MAG: Pyridoxal 5'-phosphate synthase subunit snz1 [Trichoglossum hirsutum]|nr:MAG: Pyridoxal 5'-phosphate synthase subunit snz1 [Trichoglossum hirsutum]